MYCNMVTSKETVKFKPDFFITPIVLNPAFHEGECHGIVGRNFESTVWYCACSASMIFPITLSRFLSTMFVVNIHWYFYRGIIRAAIPRGSKKPNQLPDYFHPLKNRMIFLCLWTNRVVIPASVVPCRMGSSVTDCFIVDIQNARLIPECRSTVLNHRKRIRM